MLFLKTNKKDDQNMELYCDLYIDKKLEEITSSDIQESLFIKNDQCLDSNLFYKGIVVIVNAKDNRQLFILDDIKYYSDYYYFRTIWRPLFKYKSPIADGLFQNMFTIEKRKSAMANKDIENYYVAIDCNNILPKNTVISIEFIGKSDEGFKTEWGYYILDKECYAKESASYWREIL